MSATVKQVEHVLYSQSANQSRQYTSWARRDLQNLTRSRGNERVGTHLIAQFGCRLNIGLVEERVRPRGRVVDGNIGEPGVNIGELVLVNI